MLTGYQCEIIAYLTECEIICRDCAVASTSTLTVEKADLGLANGGGLRPLIRYEIHEHGSERGYEYASQEHEEGTPEFDEAWEQSSLVCCDACGAEID